MRSLVYHPVSGSNVTESCPSDSGCLERPLLYLVNTCSRPIAVVQVWNLLSLLTCPKPPMFFGSFKILRSFCSRPSLGLQQSAWQSAATDLKWHGRIEFGADAPFGWLGAQLFRVPRCTRCTRSHCQQYPQRSHTTERHQQDSDPRPLREQVRRCRRQNQENEYKEHVPCPDKWMDEPVSCQISG